LDASQSSESEDRIDESAAAALHSRLRILLVRWTRDVELAKDLSQDVVLGLIQAIREGRLLSADALPAYAHQAARNAMLMAARRPRIDTMAEVPEGSTAWGELPRTPLESVEQAERGRLAKAALDSLATARDRKLIRDFYVDGRTKAELMDEFALSKDQFDKVISRARSRMRELVKERYEDSSAFAGPPVSAVGASASFAEDSL
jgi:RNA polymerase sigma factor (sigma-70 family)